MLLCFRDPNLLTGKWAPFYTQERKLELLLKMSAPWEGVDIFFLIKKLLKPTTQGSGDE